MIQKLKIAFQVVKSLINWPTYFLDYFGFIKNKQIIYYFKNGVQYKVRAGSNDRGIINEIYFRKIYTPPGFEIKSDDIVVDVGAQIGIFSIFASKLTPRGKVYSFEPEFQNFKLLLENIKLNNCHNIICFRQAISNKEGKDYLFINPYNVGGHSFLLPTSQKIIVPCTTLKAFIEKEKLKKIDFLKMDCEGMEYKILLNCTKDCLNKISKIALEYHDTNENFNLQKLIKFLIENNFLVKFPLEAKLSIIYAINKNFLKI